ncbi:MAG: ABC transporter permease [Candidatus Heimdallarchaeota archaeon]|nr:ABC transporter permease [Candidatus Heimdallarchaeota archaeon]MDH5644975.1 ABC transporter permease [Candidatus Heimdallarchaeota archaeon]
MTINNLKELQLKSKLGKLLKIPVIGPILKLMIILEVIVLFPYILNIFFYGVIYPIPYHRQMWSLLLSTFVFEQTLRAAIPILLTAMGGTFNERAGVINIGLEGIMLVGAWVGVYTAIITGDPWFAALMAMIAGGILGLIHGILSITFKAEQITVGVAINLFALGLVKVLSELVWQAQYSPQLDPEYKFQRLYLLKKPILGNILKYFTFSNYYTVPVIGPFLMKLPDIVTALSNQHILILIALGLIPILHILLFKTSIGLRIRVIGENPQAAATAGIAVKRYQFFAVILSGVLAGLGGATLSIGNNSSFKENMIGGRGFIAIAALIFGNWTIIGAATASLFFGLFIALNINFNSAVDHFYVPKPFIQMIPYLATIFALSGFIGKSRPPKSIGKPYDPSED